MKRILLATLNARYIHASLGIRYLLANMGPLQAQTKLLEFTVKQRPIEIAEQLLAEDPAIIGLGVYIWNARESEELVALLKTLRPEITIILGGPEVSFEQDEQRIVTLADYVIPGQGDLAFAELCQQLLDNQSPAEKIYTPTPFKLEELQFPYRYFSDADLQQRTIYVEASRGCPFKCEFCLSALDKTAVPFDQDRFLDEMEALYRRGLRRFKFVDRSFNLKPAQSNRILEFFLARLDDDLFLHFEVIPDHLPESLKSTIKRFPPGTLQLEIGVQTFDLKVQTLISRKQDNAKTEANLLWLREESNTHLHTDLIIGLPGENMAGFGTGFDRLVALRPHEIQVGILKRLRGAPISRHSEPFKLRFQPTPPYNILQTDRISFSEMQRLNRFARYWDLIANSGRFPTTLPLILGDAPFKRFLQLSDRLYEYTGQTHQIHLPRLFSLLHQGMTENLGIATTEATKVLECDFTLSGLKGLPVFNREKRGSVGVSTGKQRQQRHRSNTD
jgi:hypothetical protein